MTTPARPLRADAAKNRRKIMAAARDAITAHGPDVGMDTIARAAGVAVGTLYRHFPTKTDLVRAVIAEYTGAVAADAERARDRVRAGGEPLAELVGFLAQVVEVSATNHAVKTAAGGLGVTHHGDREAEERAHAALAEIIEAGQAAGQVHPDVAVSDAYLLMSTAPTDQPPEARDRWLRLMLPGLVHRVDALEALDPGGSTERRT